LYRIIIGTVHDTFTLFRTVAKEQHYQKQ
jgi:hypothetical protein